VEADNIRFHYAALFKESIPHAAGACAFLNEQGACRIYDCRPYVCRTQGLPLHWIEHDENGRSVALRDICPLNEKGVAVESLPKEECWRIGPAEEVLAKLQYGAYKGSLTRVKLRELFAQ
jgi:Fe-S-cluster containining protein